MADALAKLKQQMATTWENSNLPVPTNGSAIPSSPSSQTPQSPTQPETEYDEKKETQKLQDAKDGGRRAASGTAHEEVFRLAEQLSVQTEYTNKLLSQLQDLEEESLKNAREMQSREATLRRTMEAMDQARSDAKVLRMKLQNANDVIEITRREHKDALMKHGEYDRKMSSMQKLIDDKSLDLDRVTTQAQVYADQIERIQHDYAKAQTELKESQKSREEDATRFQIAAEETIREKRALETRLAPLEQELLTQKEALAKHTGRANAAVDELENLKSELNASKRRIAELEQNESALTENLLYSQSECRKFAEQVSSLESSLAEGAVETKHISNERHSLQATINRLQNNLQKCAQKEEALVKELNSAKEDVSDLQILRRNENSDFERQLADAKEEITQLLDEDKKNRAEYSEQIAANTQDYREQLRVRDEKYVKLQDDYQSLHKLMMKINEDHSNQSAIFDEERMNHEAKLTEANAKLDAAEAKARDGAAKAIQEETELQQDISALQKELVFRTERYVENLDSLRGAVVQIANAGRDLSRRIKGIEESLEQLNVNCASVSRNLKEGLKSDYNVIDDGTKRLVNMVVSLRSTVSEHTEQVAVLRLQLEDEKTRTIMLDEERSRLSHDNSALRERLDDAKRGAQIRIEASTREAEAVMTMKKDLESQLQRMMSHLDASNAQTRSLQEKNVSLQTELDNQKSKHNQSVSDLEAHVHRVELNLRTTESDRDASRVQVKALRRELGEQAAESSGLQQRLSTLEDELALLRNRSSADSAMHRNNAQSLSDSMKQLERQLTQTKSLLSTVQEQRAMLKEANAQLREELDSVYKSRALASE